MLPESQLQARYTLNFYTLDSNHTGLVVKASPCEAHDFIISNTGDVAVYVKFYNQAIAATSSDTPNLVVCVPAGWAIPFPGGGEPLYYSVGLSVRTTTGVANNDNTSPASNAVVLSISYK